MFRWFICCALMGLCVTGCRKVTPVEEVTLTSSNVSVTSAPDALSEIPWPAWRGPEGNGRAVDQELPLQWSEEENIRWRVDIPGRGHSSPVVSPTAVYLATAVKEAEEQRVLAFQREDGELLWSKTVHAGGFPSDREIHQKATNANSTVACDGERIYALFFNNGNIVATALDLQGERLWQETVGAFASKFGYAPSPILYKSLVIAAADNFGGGYIAALDGKTGQVAWRTSRPAVATYSSPIVANLGGRDQLLISGADMLASYDPGTGEMLWSTKCLAASTCGTVVTAGDHLFASGGFPDRETLCLDANGQKVWSNNTKIYEPSLVASDEFVFGVTDNGIAHCWASDTGKMLWRERLGGDFSSSPLLCNGRVYVSNLSGETTVFAAQGDRFERLSLNQLGSDTYASPAAANGELYLRIGIGQDQNRKEQLVCITQSTQLATGE